MAAHHLGPLGIGLRTRCLSRHRQPVAVATGRLQRPARPLRGTGRLLPGAGLRHLQHHVHPGRRRMGGHRPADHHRDRHRRLRPGHRTPGRTTGHGRDLHPLPRRPLRRRAGRGRPGPGGVRRGSGRGPGGIPARGGRRERGRRSRHGSPGHLPDGDAPAGRRAGPRGPGPGQGGPHRVLGTGGSHHRDHRDRPGTRAGRHPDRVPTHPGVRGTGRDALLLPGPPRPLHGRELHRHHAQRAHPARRPGA